MDERRAARLEYQRRWREDRKAEVGRCTRCKRTGLPDGAAMCDRCRKRYRKAHRKYQRERRQEARDRGLCGVCLKVKSEAYRCAACVVRQGRVPPSIAAQKPGQNQGDQWRADGDGWARYRGKGQRGAPGAAVNDEQDLASAADALEKGRIAMRYARSPQVLALPRIQRRGALNEAIAQLALAARFLDDVVERNSDDG